MSTNVPVTPDAAQDKTLGQQLRESGSPEWMWQLPDDEIRSLTTSMWAARELANAMALNGARVMGGDVQGALARLGLRLVCADDVPPGYDDVDSGHYQRVGYSARARLDEITETADCGCYAVWVRLRDVTGAGAGWWHHTDENGFSRKCPDGERRLSAAESSARDAAEEQS